MFKSSPVKTAAIVSLLAGVQACSTWDVMTDKAVKIDGDVHYYNAQGEIELNQEQVDLYESQGDVVRIKHIAPEGALIIDPDEMTVLMRDNAVFFAEVDKKSVEGEIAVLIKKGPLKRSIEHIAEMAGWKGVTWESYEYHVEKPFAVVGSDVETVVMEAVSDYPVYVRFNVDEKTILVSNKKSD